MAAMARLNRTALQASSGCHLSLSPSCCAAVRHGPSLLTEKMIQAFKTECLRKLLSISYLEHKTYDLVWSKIIYRVGPQEPLLATVKRWKLTWFRCHSPWKPLQNHSSFTFFFFFFGGGGRWGHLGGWVTPWSAGGWMTPWSAQEMLDGQHGVDIPPALLTASCREDWKRVSTEILSFPPSDLIRQGTELNWTIELQVWNTQQINPWNPL